MHEPTIHRATSRADALLAVAGPVTIGAILGLSGDGATSSLISMMRDAALLPLVLAGVAAAMVPALYIATSLAGAAPPARDMARALAHGFRAAGVIMLGLAAPMAFLLATSHSRTAAVLLGAAVTAAGALVGLRALFAGAFTSERDPTLVRAVFGLWSLVFLAIGARMYGQLIAG